MSPHRPRLSKNKAPVGIWRVPSTQTAYSALWNGPDPVRGQDALLSRFAASYHRWRALPRRTRRMLQRHLAKTVAGAACLLTLGQDHCFAATLTVDVGCALIDAITAANTDTSTGGCTAGSGPDTIVLPAGSIQMLTAVNNSTYGATGLPVVSSLLTIEGNGSTITRASGAPAFRILTVNKKGDLTLKDSTITGGETADAQTPHESGGGVANFAGVLTLQGSTITGNTALGADGVAIGAGGGGVLNYGGSLTIESSTITGNTALNGGGMYSYTKESDKVALINTTVSGNSGSGMLVRAKGDSVVTLHHTMVSGNSGQGVASITYGNSQVTLSHCTISGNTAYFGAGVWGYAKGNSQITLTYCTVSSNTATSWGGGGIEFDTYGGSRARLANSTVSGNFALSGGGVATYAFDSGQVMLSNNTINDNAAEFGGGVANNAYAKGHVLLSNNTITGNSSITANGSGGGVANFTTYSGQVTLNHTTISGNTAATGGGVYSFIYDDSQVILSHTLIAGNTASNGAEVFRHNNGGSLTANDFNLVGHSSLTSAQAFTGFTPGATDLTTTADGVVPTALAAILDSTLQNNGGPTQTLNLVSGSPALDAVGAGCKSSRDQRGFARLIDGNHDMVRACDIGALEFGSTPDPCATALPTLGCTVNGRPNQPCIGTSGDDTIIGTLDNDVILGLGGKDIVRGQAGGDLLCGNEGNDVLIGGQGSDWLEGGEGNNTIEGSEGDDTLASGSGKDVLNGGAGDDALDGEEGEDTLTGGAGSDECLNGEKLASCE